VRIARHVGRFCFMEMPLLMKQAYVAKARQEKLAREARRLFRKSNEAQLSNRRQSIARMWKRMNGQQAQRAGAAQQFPTLARGLAHTKNFITIPNPASSTYYPEKSNFDTLVEEDAEDEENYPKKSTESDHKDSSPCVEWTSKNHGEESAIGNVPASLRGSAESLAAGLYGSCLPVGIAEVDANEAELRSRNLAQLEYDWLAAVTERLFLFLFFILFFVLSIGINGIGIYRWYFVHIKRMRHA